MANLGSNFYTKLVDMTSRLGMKPEDLLAIMVSESGIDPSAGHEASGLIQFMPFILPGVGFHGSPEEFRNLNGEQQLPYIENYIKDKMRYNGGAFSSPAQYYVANFWPVALKLPGIKAGDPSTIFMEANPERVGQWSKKYYDIGIKVSAAMEAGAYKANPLFHGSTPGAITYGDMLKQVDKNKQTSMYRQALQNMKSNTGYQAPIPEKNTDKSNKDYLDSNQQNSSHQNVIQKYLSMLGDNKPSEHKDLQSFNPSVNQVLTNYLKLISQASKDNNNHFIIKIESNDFNNSLEFSRILCSALKEELSIRAYPHTDGFNIVEIEGKTNSSNYKSINKLSSQVSQDFLKATNKIGGVKINASIILNKQSDYLPVSFKQADSNYRQFLIKYNKQ